MRQKFLADPLILLNAQHGNFSHNEEILSKLFKRMFLSLTLQHFSPQRRKSDTRSIEAALFGDFQADANLNMKQWHSLAGTLE